MPESILLLVYNSWMALKQLRGVKPLAVMLPLGELVAKEEALRPLGELLPYPKPAGSVRRPCMWPREVMLPEAGDPLAVMLPLKGECTPACYQSSG